MPNRDTPIGLRPAQGIGSQHVLKMFPVNSANTTAVFVGDVMDLDGNAVGPAATDAGIAAIRPLPSADVGSTPASLIRSAMNSDLYALYLGYM